MWGNEKLHADFPLNVGEGGSVPNPHVVKGQQYVFFEIDIRSLQTTL